ncbi:unnamed protein product [Peniophora sp. CBMAI 1063]|nr:unnamed protein product [Peniophora sp. CBMAI 1063]
MSASNSTLSDSDIETLSAIGHATVESIVSLVVEAILYTIYFALVIIVGRVLLNFKSRTRTSIAIFVIILLMLMLDTAICIIDVHNAIVTITATLYPASSSESLTDRYDSLNLPWMVENALTGFMANLGDVIIIWRTWAFYKGPRERWLLLIPISLLIGSLTSSSLLAYCVTKFDAVPGSSDFAKAPFCTNLTPTQGYSVELASMVLATTAAATAMICWKTWTYRRTIGANLRLNKNKTRAEKIMVILIESGVLYFLFFLQVLISSSTTVNDAELSTPSLQFATNVWTYMTNHILGAYPVLVVILVRSQRSYIEGAINSDVSISTRSSNSRSYPERHTLPSHRFEHGTSTIGTMCSESEGTTRYVPGRDHFLDIDVHERRPVRDDQSFSDVSRVRTRGDDAEGSEVQSVKFKKSSRKHGQDTEKA